MDRNTVIVLNVNAITPPLDRPRPPLLWSAGASPVVHPANQHSYAERTATSRMLNLQLAIIPDDGGNHER
jgi:hypothetical protein